MLGRYFIVMTLVACASPAPDGLTPSAASGKADAPFQLCGVQFNGLEQRSIGEVGELDLPPRLTANTRAAAWNAHFDHDCVNQIDSCVVPSYYVDEDDKILVEIAGEVIVEKQIYIDGELHAVQRQSAACVVCSPGTNCAPIP